MILKGFFFLVLTGFLSACEYPTQIPVLDANDLHQRESKGIHFVRKGETLYAIAWLYNQDYRDIAAYNGLKAPYALRMGQVLRVKPPPSSRSYYAEQALLVKKKHAHFYLPEKNTNMWVWPTHGKISQYFSLNQGHKGIEIVGNLGQAIYAASSGRIAFSGSGNKIYGNLLIIKHNDDYLSAYAYNRRLFVKEGDFVKAGQKIAEMGSMGGREPKCHFEIRLAGKPVNPLIYLK